MISHLFACTWINFGLNESDEHTWLTNKDLLNKNWTDQYISSYYFATVTMLFFLFYKIRITVGYGDILPVNSSEMVLCIFTMMIACGVFGYSLNTIGQIIQDFFKNDAEINDNLNIINNYMYNKNIS